MEGRKPPPPANFLVRLHERIPPGLRDPGVVECTSCQRLFSEPVASAPCIRPGFLAISYLRTIQSGAKTMLFTMSCQVVRLPVRRPLRIPDPGTLPRRSVRLRPGQVPSDPRQHIGRMPFRRGPMQPMGTTNTPSSLRYESSVPVRPISNVGMGSPVSSRADSSSRGSLAPASISPEPASASTGANSSRMVENGRG